MSQIGLALGHSAALFKFCAILSSMGILEVPLLLIFTLAFVRKLTLLKRWYIPVLLFAPSIILLYVSWATNLLIIPDISKATIAPWGYSPGVGALIGLMVLYYVLYDIPVIVLMVQHYRHSQQAQKRKEVKYFLIGLAIPVVGGPIVQAGIPRILHVTVSFPASPIFIATTLIFMTYALRKYGGSIFNPEGVIGGIGPVLPGALLVLDHTHTIQYLNQGGTELLGYSSGQLIGSGLLSVLGDNRALEEFTVKVLRPLHTSATISVEDLTIKDKSGQRIPVNVNASMTTTEDGEVSTILIFTSIAGLKEAQTQLTHEKASVEQKVIERTRELTEVQARLAASLSGLPFGFAIVDPQDRIVFHNAALHKLLNRPIPVEPTKTHAVLAKISADYKPAIDLLACLHAKEWIEKRLQDLAGSQAVAKGDVPRCAGPPSVGAQHGHNQYSLKTPSAVSYLYGN